MAYLGILTTKPLVISLNDPLTKILYFLRVKQKVKSSLSASVSPEYIKFLSLVSHWLLNSGNLATPSGHKCELRGLY